MPNPPKGDGINNLISFIFNSSTYTGILQAKNRPTLKCPEESGSDKKLSKFTAQDTKYGNGMLKTKIGTD